MIRRFAAYAACFSALLSSCEITPLEEEEAPLPPRLAASMNPMPKTPLAEFTNGAPEEPAAEGASPLSVPAPRQRDLSPLLVGERKRDLYASFLPRGEMFDRLFTRRTYLYDEDSTPRLYQVFDRRNDNIVSPAGVASANNEFPWNLPAGVVAGSNVKTFRWFQTEQPVLWWRKVKQDGTLNGFDWFFPVGTRFGEVILVTDSKGFDHTSLMRTRQKNQRGEWIVQEYKPFPREEDLRDELLARFNSTFGHFPVRSLSVDSGHVRNGFTARAFATGLPDLEEQRAINLLDRGKFKPCKGTTWNEQVSSPTPVGFHILPKGFAENFIAVDNQSCSRCHEDAGKVVNQSGQERWRLRGNDRIFSFHIFSVDGQRMNERLVSAGLLQHARGLP